MTQSHTSIEVPIDSWRSFACIYRPMLAKSGKVVQAGRNLFFGDYEFVFQLFHDNFDMAVEVSGNIATSHLHQLIDQRANKLLEEFHAADERVDIRERVDQLIRETEQSRALLQQAIDMVNSIE